MHQSFPSPPQHFFDNDPSQKLQLQLLIKQYFFDHFIFPAPHKLSPSSLESIFSNLESKVSLDQFSNATLKFISSLNKQDIEIYFIMHQLAQNEINVDMVKQLINKKNQPADSGSLCLFFYLQLYMQTHRQSISYENRMLDFNVAVDVKNQQFFERSAGKQGIVYSPLNSPRAKTMRIQTQTNELQQINLYLKNNIRQMLRFVSHQYEDENDNQIITTQDFNLFSLFLKSLNKPNLYCPLFDRQNKCNLNSLSDWVKKNTGYNENGSDYKYKQYSDNYVISGFCKSVTIKPYDTVSQDVKIINCEDSLIFIDYPVRTLLISQCQNCQIFVSACKLMTTISICDRVTVCLASNFLRISNTIDSTIHYYGSFSPVIYGDSRSITLAPHNGNTQKLLDRLKEAQIPLLKQSCDRFQFPIIMHGNQNIDYQIMIKEDFQRMILPEEQFGIIDYSLIEECGYDIERMGKEITDKKLLMQPLTQDKIIIPLLSPVEYQKAIFERYKLFANLQATIKQSGIVNEDQKLLQLAIMGNFREWLMTTGNVKPLSDLVKIIIQDNQ